MTSSYFEDAAVRARHLAADVQQFGLFSAVSVVDRYAAMADRAVSDEWAASSPSQADGYQQTTLVDGVTRLAHAYLQFLATTANLVGYRPAGGGTVAGREVLLLPSVLPAHRSEEWLWIHNPTPEPSTGIAIWVSGLTSSDGETLPVAAVSVSPPNIDRLDPGTSRQLRLRVDVPTGQPPGHYHGLVLISVAPAEPMALHIEVGAAP
ncbi:hypothetical protein BH23ACT5_BH23ACT5_15540 [soil metagenome]